MYLIAGLGNPGRFYVRTRHNVGFMLVDRIAKEVGKKFKRLGAHSLTCRVERARQSVILAKPQAFMNLSGPAVRELLDHCPVELSQLLIVYDDLALPLGAIRIRASGSSGGHKGMRSVIEALGTHDVPRLRIGILQGEIPAGYSEFVLHNFTKEESEILEEVFDRAIEAIDTLLSNGLERAMSLYN
ncbi:MAG: aminoacyl-tRNA hydrolase [Acidobacteriota bacterium]